MAWGPAQSIGTSVGWLAVVSMPRQVPACHTLDWSRSADTALECLLLLVAATRQLQAAQHQTLTGLHHAFSPDHSMPMVNLLFGSNFVPR